MIMDIDAMKKIGMPSTSVSKIEKLLIMKP